MGDLPVILAAWFAVSCSVLALWSMLPRAHAGARRRRAPVGGRRRAVATQGLLLAASCIGAIVAHRPADWDPGALVIVLAALALAGDAAPLSVGRYRFSSAFLAIVLAMALLGPAPAVFIGLICAGVDAVRSRTRGSWLLNNLAAYAAFPLIGALALQPLAGASPLALAVATACVAVGANFLNFVVIAEHARTLRGDRVGEAIRAVWLPVLPWEVATAVLTGLTVAGYVLLGPAAVAVFALAVTSLHVVAARIASSVRAKLASAAPRPFTS